jgi:hypothetical protein
MAVSRGARIVGRLGPGDAERSVPMERVRPNLYRQDEIVSQLLRYVYKKRTLNVRLAFADTSKQYQLQ